MRLNGWKKNPLKMCKRWVSDEREKKKGVDMSNLLERICMLGIDT